MGCGDGVGNKLSSSFRSFFRLAKHFATHYWRARSMNRKDGRSIDWRWGSLIPLSADDGVYGDQNKSVKKARDDTKGKFAEIFSCSGRLEASLKLFFSFLSPIVFLLFPTFFLFCLHFYIQIGSHRKFGFQHFLYLFALRISCPVLSKLLRHSVSANGSVDRNQVGRRRERLVVRFFMGFVLFLHAVADFGSWETGNGWNWCFCLVHRRAHLAFFKPLVFLGRRVDACLQLLPCSRKIVLMACWFSWLCSCSSGFSPILT